MGYHRTSAGAAILRDGFQDGMDTYMTDREWSGVWVSDVPLDEQAGATGEDVLVIQVPARLFRRYEWVEEGQGYREALIPAETLNRYPRSQVP